MFQILLSSNSSLTGDVLVFVQCFQSDFFVFSHTRTNDQTDSNQGLKCFEKLEGKSFVFYSLNVERR